MKKKIILIWLIATIATIVIYHSFNTTKINLLALGDGVASGMTGYNVEGYSFNDYLRDYYQSENKIDRYTRAFVKKGQTIEDLLFLLENNSVVESKNNNLTILQIIANSNLITIAIGTDEIVTNKSFLSDEEILSTIINNMEKVIKKIRSFSSKKIIIIGPYYHSTYSNELVDKINNSYQQISDNYNCAFIDVRNIINSSDYFSKETSHYMNYKGHNQLYLEIVKSLE